MAEEEERHKGSLTPQKPEAISTYVHMCTWARAFIKNIHQIHVDNKGLIRVCVKIDDFYIINIVVFRKGN
jgi:hypothetical protein